MYYPAGKDFIMKHLTFNDRLHIQKSLTINDSFITIAENIGKNRTTISREIKAYSRTEGKPSRSKCKNTCVFEDRSECPVPICNKRECSITCAQCAKYCDKYEPYICKDLKKAPYVCNGCEKRSLCSLEKKLYDAEFAQREYKRILKESREGVSLTEEEIFHIADTIIPLIRNGVSLPIAYAAYADSMPVSCRTIYGYIDKGMFDIDNTDLRRKVCRKPTRKKSGPMLCVDKNCHIGRTYADFEKYIQMYPEINVCETDSVEGKRGGKVILTIFFRNCNLQLMYIRNANTSESVTLVFNKLRKKLGDDFKKVFPLILGDRGSEFSNPSAIEINVDTGEIESRFYYCDPQQTNQKSRCERNHEYIRYIIPKGTSLDDFTQDDIDLVMNHVNSMPRGSLNATTPIQLFIDIYGIETARRLGLEYISLEQLCLTPKLLKK
jgi:IS30 family transposase